MEKDKKETVYFFTEEDYSNMSNPAFTMEQLILLREPTPEDEIEYKEDVDGWKYKTVKGSYVKKRLNLIFGFNWDFKIIDREYLQNASEVIVHGRLIIRSNNHKIKKEQFGKHSVTIVQKSNSNRTFSFPSEIGNAFKSAATDALKKCASEIGICWDIYSQEKPESEKQCSEEESHADKKITERLEHFLNLATTPDEIDNVEEKFKESGDELTEARKNLITTYRNKMQKSKS